MRRKLIGILSDFNSWISKLKLLSRLMASFTYSEGCCSLLRMVRSVICLHRVSILQEAAAVVNSDLSGISDQPLSVYMRSPLHPYFSLKLKSIDTRNLRCTIIFCHDILTLLLQLLTDCG